MPPDRQRRDIRTTCPVILPPAASTRSLDPKQQDASSMADLLVPCRAEGLVAEPISTVINSPRNEGPECVAPLVE